MRILLLLSLFVGVASGALAQSTAKPAPPPATAKPATPAPAPPQTAPAQPARPAARRPAQQQPSARGGIALTVTTPDGATLPDVRVELTGPAAGDVTTNASGQANFPGLQPGTYRLRFTGDAVTAFERELTVRRGAIERLNIQLNPPPARAAAAAPPPPPAPTVGPVGSPQLGSLINLAERERNTKEPRREILLSCSGNTRNMLLVLTHEQPQRLYESAEGSFYVIAGQGSARVGALQSVIGEGSFIAVPRGTPFVLSRQGNRPLALLWTLSGEPCEQAR